MRAKPILISVIVLAVLALIVRQVGLAVKHTFAPPAGLAQVDRSTPAYQDGLTLMELQNVSPDRSYNYTDKGPQDIGGSSNAAPAADTGLWIKLPPNFSLPPNCTDSQFNTCGNSPSITGCSSTGETFPLVWHLSPNSGLQGNYLLASIPAGYPNTCRWADVTMDDKAGDKATWRITHLPPMQHVLAPPVTPQTTFHQGSVQAIARAYGGVDPNLRPPLPTIRYDLKGTITGATHQWELGHLTQTLEWEPPNFVPQEAGMTEGMEKSGSKVMFRMDEQSLFYNRSLPYLRETHFVRLSASLQEFETYDETITFHNASVVKVQNGGQYLAGTGPQSVTTASGVTVTLDDVQHRQNFNGIWGGDGYSVHLLYPQTMRFASLPRSPLWQKYKRPIIVRADVPKQYQSEGSSNGDSEGTYHFHTNWHLPMIMPNFPMIIHQRVDLRSLPMTFTLPVLDKAPVKH